ncbi:MAG: protoheme IX farnesyltransferase [Anaerolineae bacterium]
MNHVDKFRPVSASRSFISTVSMLIKSRQTFMLVGTGLAGYVCQHVSPFNWPKLAGLAGSLFLAISGATILNMVFDRDIDRQMERTRRRPLAAGQLDTHTAFILGLATMMVGLAWALTLSLVYALIVLMGICFDLVVYTIWLKRRSAWSIIWGGIAGGMPILAGTTLSSSRVDLPGVILALAIVCWIPGHNLTLNMLHPDDYLKAEIPTILGTIGCNVSRFLVLCSGLSTAILLSTAAFLLHAPLLVNFLIGFCGSVLAGLAVYLQVNPGRKMIYLLYKANSFYMMVVMILIGFIGLA